MRSPGRSWRSCKARTRRRSTKRQKELSTKGHEERRRATKGLEDAREGPAKGRAGGRSNPPPGARASRPHKPHLGARASRPHKDHPGARASRPHKLHLGARASRPHKAWHDGREPRKGGFGAPCKGVALDGRLFAGIRMRAGRPRSRVDCPPNTNRSPPQHFGLRRHPVTCQLLQRARIRPPASRSI